MNLLSFLVQGAVALASALPPVSTDLPFDIHVLQHAVASVQSAACLDIYNSPGSKFGDETLLHSFTVNNGEQRVNILDSETQGIIVAYQGTNLTSFDSVLHDTLAWHTPASPELGLSDKALIYFGFQDQWSRTWPQVEAALADILQKQPGKKVLFTGHSMGASMCQLAALGAYHSFGDIVSYVVSIEPPRTGNHQYSIEFDQLFKGRYTGITMGKDWVPSVPPRFLDYQHPSGMIWINPPNSTSWTFYPDSEDPRGPNSRIPEYINVDALLRGDLSISDFIYWDEHRGIFFNTTLEIRKGPCPAIIPT